MDQPGVDIYEVPLSPIKPKKIRARKSTPKPPMRPAPAVVVEDEHDLETMFSALKSSTRDTASRGFKASRKSISVEEPLSSQSANQLSEQPRKFIMAKPLRTAREPKIGFKLPRINKQLTVDPVEADVEEADKRATHQYEVYTPEGHSILSDTSDLIKSQLNISHGRNKVLADEADVVQISKDSEFRIQGKKATKTDSIQKTAKRRGQTANNIDEPRKVRRTTTGKMSSEKTYDVEYIFDHYVDKKAHVLLRVKWKGYDSPSDTTWEKESTLHDDIPEILDDYYARHGGRDQIILNKHNRRFAVYRKGDTESQQSYEVESIVDEEVVDGLRRYKIRWKGWDEQHDEWKEASQLSNAQGLIAKYKRKGRGGKSLRRRKG